LENLKERDHMGNAGTGRRIIISDKYGIRVCTVQLTQDTVLCKSGDVSLGSTKAENS
jgi:hypothetical protein